MLEVRASSDRGHANFGWLLSKHSFPFGNYYDPQQLGFRFAGDQRRSRSKTGKGLIHTDTVIWDFSMCWKGRWSTKIRWVRARDPTRRCTDDECQFRYPAQ